MKTFSEFIIEAEIKWNTGVLKGSGKSPSSTASQKITQLGRQMSTPRTTPQQMTKIAQRVKKMKSVISGASEVAKVSDPRPESLESKRGSNTKIRGYASKGKDPVSSTGTLGHISRQRITDIRTGKDLGSASTPGVNISGRYSDTRSRSQKGGKVPTRNIGQGYSSPERGNYSD